MGDEPRTPEEAKSEALAAFAAVASVIDFSGAPATEEQALAVGPIRAAAVRHLSAALEIMGRAKGGSA